MSEHPTTEGPPMPTPNGNLQLLLTGDADRFHTLTIKDPVSGITIADVELDNYALAELIGRRTTGSVDGVPARIYPDLDRIGKHAARASVNLATVFQVGGDRDQVLKTWAGMVQNRIRAYGYRISHYNQGRTGVSFVAYFADREEADAWAAEADFLLAELRGTAPGGGAA